MLLVVIEAGLFYASQRPSEGYAMHMDQELARRNWLRTVQSSFGWDWSTQLLNVGITEDVTLEIAAGVRYDRMVALATVSDDLRSGHVTARVFAQGLTDEAQEGKLIVDLTGLSNLSGLSVEVPVTIEPGANRLEAALDVANPELWWPVGHGAQPLCTVQATLVVGGEVVAEDCTQGRVPARARQPGAAPRERQLLHHRDQQQADLLQGRELRPGGHDSRAPRSRTLRHAGGSRDRVELQSVAHLGRRAV